MPYLRHGKCVYKKKPDGSKGELVGCSDSVAEARRYLRALYMHADKSIQSIVVSKAKAKSFDEAKRLVPNAYRTNHFQETDASWVFRQRPASHYADLAPVTIEGLPAGVSAITGILKQKETGKKDYNQTTKRAANYDPLGGIKNGGAKACANCFWYNPGSKSCVVVSGQMTDMGVSDLWKDKEETIKTMVNAEPHEMMMDMLDASGMPAHRMAYNLATQRMMSNAEFEDDTDALETEIDALIDQLEKGTLAEGGFKAVNERVWLAWHTNAFEDKDKEIFTTAAHDDYIEAVDSGEWPQPEVWYWHVPVKVGQCEWIGRAGRIVISAGTFRNDEVGQRFAAHIKAFPHKTSHGYYWSKAQYDDHERLYHWYRTFEISPLPEDKEANETTLFVPYEEILPMAISKQKLDRLAEILGSIEAAETEIAKGEATSKQKEEEGVRYKGDGETPDKTTQKPDKSGAKPTKAAVTPAKGKATAAIGEGAILDQRLDRLEKAVTRLAELVTEQAEKTQEQLAQQKAAQEEPEVDELDERLKALEDLIAGYEEEAVPASRSRKTVVDKKDPQLQRLKTELGKVGATGFSLMDMMLNGGGKAEEEEEE